MIFARFQFVLVSVLIHAAIFYFASQFFQHQGDHPSVLSNMEIDYVFAQSGSVEPVMPAVGVVSSIQQPAEAITIESNNQHDVIALVDNSPKEMTSPQNEVQFVEVTSEPIDAASISVQGLATLENWYKDDLQKAIERHKRYPLKSRRRGEEGEVEVSFSILKDGAIIGIQIASSSGYVGLDRASSSALERLNRFKPIPQQLGRESWSFQVPVSFKLN